MGKFFFIITKFLLLITGLISCSKEKRACWQAFDPFSQQDVNGIVYCDKTKAEAEATDGRWMYYKKGAPKYCWKVVFNGTSTHYESGIPEEIAQKYMQTNGAYQYSKVDCGSFCNVSWLEKKQSKITGLYSPNQIITESFGSSDTCSKLFVGRVIVYRETTDSLITRELQTKRP